jgi:5-(carboxyamino)imidazole ribonucleotide mutase
MGSTSDLPVMEKAALLLDEMEVPFEINALSAHRTPAEVEEFARGAASRGIRVIIAAAGMAAALPGVIAANTTLPVIGVPIKGMLDGLDALLSIVQMPPGIPVATVGVNGAQNAAILAVQMLALSDETVAARLAAHKEGLKQKIVKANADLILRRESGRFHRRGPIGNRFVANQKLRHIAKGANVVCLLHIDDDGGRVGASDPRREGVAVDGL